MIGEGEIFYQFVGEKEDLGANDNLAVIPDATERGSQVR